MFELAPYQLFICLCIINSFDNFLVVIFFQHYPRCSCDKDKWPHIATKEKLNSVASGWKTKRNHSGCLEQDPRLQRITNRLPIQRQQRFLSECSCFEIKSARILRVPDSPSQMKKNLMRL